MSLLQSSNLLYRNLLYSFSEELLSQIMLLFSPLVILEFLWWKTTKHHPNMNQSQKVHTTPMNEILFSCLGVLQVHFNVKSLISGLALVNSKNKKLLSKYHDFMDYQTFFLMKWLHFTKFLTRKSACSSIPLLVTICLKQKIFVLVITVTRLLIT